MSDLEFAWDPAKALSNLSKHGVTFEQAAAVLADPLSLSVLDEAHSDAEERWFTLGMAPDGHLLAVSHTYNETGPDSAHVRIISVRRATRAERRQYENEPTG